MLPPLPPLHGKLAGSFRGPTEYTNWVIPEVLMAGCYPGALEDARHTDILRRILNKGIDTFVCLQEEFKPDISEARWRMGRGLRPYMPDAERLSKKNLKWLHVPIPDGMITSDEVTLSNVLELLDDIKKGRVLYVHCWGGHGRTGVFVSLLLVGIYRISAVEAMKRVQRYHDCRLDPQDARSPQSVVQREQVKRLARRVLELLPAEPEAEHVDLSQPRSSKSSGRPAGRPTRRCSSLPSCRKASQQADSAARLPSVQGVSQEQARASLCMRHGTKKGEPACSAHVPMLRKSFA